MPGLLHKSFPVGMLGCNIELFVRVFHHVVQNKRPPLFHPDGFPIAVTNGLLKSAFKELPVEEIVRSLSFAEQCGNDRYSVDVLGRRDAGQLQ